jgi:hypothetical protein
MSRLRYHWRLPQPLFRNSSNSFRVPVLSRFVASYTSKSAKGGWAACSTLNHRMPAGTYDGGSADSLRNRFHVDQELCILTVETHTNVMRRITAGNQVRPLRVLCHEIHPFNAGALESLMRVFREARPLSLRQAWLPREEPKFAPGSVRLGWQHDALLVFADLTDANIFTRATAMNQRLWELGDTFEIFLQPVGRGSYTEFQVAPNNLHLRLRYPDAGAIALARRSGRLDRFRADGGTFRSATWVRPADRKWFVFATISAEAVGAATGSPAGAQWRFSFGRYDYTRGCKAPVISSTSPHLLQDFHRQSEWGSLRFQSRP